MMTAAEEGAAGDIAAAVAARVAALKALGFEEALKGLLEAHRGGGGVVRPVSAGVSESPGSRAAAQVGAGAAAVATAEYDTQDLVERLQTALEQLGVRDQ